MIETNYTTNSKRNVGKCPSINDDDSSALISSHESKISNKDQLSSLKPLIVDENNVIQPKKLKTETSASREALKEPSNNESIMDLEAKMQRERARILGGYTNSLGNAQRVRQDQVMTDTWSDKKGQ